jgi:Protein of unknown function (DUF1275)
LSIARSGTVHGFAFAGGFLAGKLDSLLGKQRSNIWFAVALGIWRNDSLMVLRTSRAQHIFVALYGIIALTALGMGMRNGTVKRLAVPELTTSVITLTVAALAFAFSLAPGNSPKWRRRVSSVVMMFSGAFVGVQLLKHSLVLLRGASAVLTAFCTLAQLYREETQHEAGSRSRNADDPRDIESSPSDFGISRCTR